MSPDRLTPVHRHPDVRDDRPEPERDGAAARDLVRRADQGSTTPCWPVGALAGAVRAAPHEFERRGSPSEAEHGSGGRPPVGHMAGR